MLPFRMGSDAEFQSVRDLFTFCGYTAEATSKRLGVDFLPEYNTIRQGRTTALCLEDPLDVLIRLFLDGEPVAAETVEAMMPPGAIAALHALDILRPHPEVEGSLAATVMLYPVRGLWIASDLDAASPGIERPDDLPRPDHVFSAITNLSANFIRQLPSSPTDRFLELCGGTGIAALLAASSARHVWSTDITGRSTEFADFNARLNGITNFTALQGDLYEPVRGLTFNRIVAHPPYVPAPENRMIFRDGGEDGEQIIRGILAGLADHLEPGGTFHCTCTATERLGAPLEKRLREMLGAAEEEFDVVLMTRDVSRLGEHYFRLAVAGRISYAKAEQLITMFLAKNVVQITYCNFILQRRSTPRPTFTVRRPQAATASAVDADQLRAWYTARADGTAAARLMDSAPRMSPHLRLQITHEPRDGAWALSGSEIQVTHPFERTVDISVNAAMLLNLCDGTIAARDIIARLRSSGAIGDEVPDSSFIEFMLELVSEGVLLLDPVPLPADSGATPAASLAAARSL